MVQQRITAEPESLVMAGDLGGTNFRLALVTRTGEIIRRLTLPTPKGKGADHLLDRMAAAILGLMEEEGIIPGRLQAVGMGIAGLIQPDKGRVVKSPNIPELDWIWLGPELRRRLPWPVTIDNDANLFALGEHYQGAGRGEDNLLGLTLGTGVGGGLILNGRLWQGAGGPSAEVGHITIDPEGERCSCGNQGCLETLASATWTVRWTAERLAAGQKSLLQKNWRENPEGLSALTIYQAATAGDALAQKAFQRVGRALGIAIADVVHLLGIPLIIIGGNFAQSWDRFIGPLREELERRLTFFPAAKLVIRPAALGDNGGLLGAARLAWMQVSC
ncbi:ROK family protein [Desulfobacca acetoxidans]|uniref:Glucokinase n=1 Tax=Desulfobacca acetoxidans (strain ATCC 700848 / DSM 11109 / ASRB2) TaxID=880072 RepID=F2NH75_DESAR|nr:ROK family protein [Desulfobacca acetoxidans]AEB08917.1 Glucokinase [Desulfobacca acetoxidans DSM 11109]